METKVTDYEKLLEIEQSNRINLETQMDELQRHNRSVGQQVNELKEREKILEKTAEDQKLQITQMERVRYPFLSFFRSS